MLQSIALWLNTPIFAIDRRPRSEARPQAPRLDETLPGLGLRVMAANPHDAGNGNGLQDQVGFFRVAGLIRTLLAILVPALVLQGVFLNLMIKDRVRDAVDGIYSQVVSQKEFSARREELDRRNLETDSHVATVDRELRERIVQLESKVRVMELEQAQTRARVSRGAP